jgi:hypothetical protein
MYPLYLRGGTIDSVQYVYKEHLIFFTFATETLSKFEKPSCCRLGNSNGSVNSRQNGQKCRVEQCQSQ